MSYQSSRFSDSRLTCSLASSILFLALLFGCGPNEPAAEKGGKHLSTQYPVLDLAAHFDWNEPFKYRFVRIALSDDLSWRPIQGDHRPEEVRIIEPGTLGHKLLVDYLKQSYWEMHEKFDEASLPKDSGLALANSPPSRWPQTRAFYWCGIIEQGEGPRRVALQVNPSRYATLVIGSDVYIHLYGNPAFEAMSLFQLSMN